MAGTDRGMCPGSSPEGDCQCMWPKISRLRIYLRPGSTDMRKQIYSLAVLVERESKQPLFTEDLFLLCSKSKRVLKILYCFEI